MKSINSRWNLIVPGDFEHTLNYCARHFIDCAKEAIQDHGAFYVALSGGSTPKAIFQKLSQSPYKEQIDWSKVYLFWSDERAVAPDHIDSNYHMAMKAGLETLPILPSHIFRMHAETDIEKNASHYEKTIQSILKGRPFDLMTLGMGDDGHTASLFPHTLGLKDHDHLVIANHIPQKSCFRMTMTFKQINHSRHIAIYVLGAPKKPMLTKVLSEAKPNLEHPITFVGVDHLKALWIADNAAAPDSFHSISC